MVAEILLVFFVIYLTVTILVFALATFIWLIEENKEAAFWAIKSWMWPSTAIKWIVQMRKDAKEWS